MATPTYTPLATVTLASTDSEIVFSSIPATYRDLILIVEGTGSSAAYVRFQVNSDTGNNFSYVQMAGYSGGTFTSATTAAFIQPTYSEASQKTNSLISFMDYSATDKHKTFLTRAMGYDAGLSTWANAGRWASTSAITTVKIYRDAGSWNSGSTFSLFGVN